MNQTHSDGDVVRQLLKLMESGGYFGRDVEVSFAPIGFAIDLVLLLVRSLNWSGTFIDCDFLTVYEKLLRASLSSASLNPLFSWCWISVVSVTSGACKC